MRLPGHDDDVPRIDRSRQSAITTDHPEPIGAIVDTHDIRANQRQRGGRDVTSSAGKGRGELIVGGTSPTEGYTGDPDGFRRTSIGAQEIGGLGGDVYNITGDEVRSGASDDDGSGLIVLLGRCHEHNGETPRSDGADVGADDLRGRQVINLITIDRLRSRRNAAGGTRHGESGEFNRLTRAYVSIQETCRDRESDGSHGVSVHEARKCIADTI